MRSVYAKELYIYFSSPIFYVVAGIFLCITGIFFYNNMVYVSLLASQIAQYQISTGISLNDILLRPLFADMSLLILFLIPIISMRLYAEERAQGTIELLFTYPLSDLQILAAKYLAGLTVLVVIGACTLVLMVLISLITSADWGLIISSYLGLLLMVSAFLALGVFASSLTRNQIVAASISLGLILGFWAIGWFANTINTGPIATFLKEISLLGHLGSFLKGMVTLKDIAFYFCFTLFFLFLTLRILERRTWRG
ncbi:MAG: ABC transporter permease subunit [Deltaproteobacteria bacterium]|nr:ABC transporter permease subunit [Deltaproteobacteria bacterium]